MIDPAASPLSFFASEMVRLRSAAGLSQPGLAKRLNYSASQVAKIETCQRIPKRDLAGRLDEILETDGLFSRLQPLGYIRDRDEVARYSLTFDHLRGSALADDKSAALIGVMAT